MLDNQFRLLKHSSNWIVFVIAVVYAMRSLARMLGGLFIAGNNDTAMEILGLIAAGICPTLALVFSFRRRRIAAVFLILGAVLWIVGVIDGNRYLASKLGEQMILTSQFRLLLRTSAFAFGLSFYYAITDWLGWPALLDVDFR